VSATVLRIQAPKNSNRTSVRRNQSFILFHQPGSKCRLNISGIVFEK